MPRTWLPKTLVTLASMVGTAALAQDVQIINHSKAAWTLRCVDTPGDPKPYRFHTYDSWGSAWIPTDKLQLPPMGTAVLHVDSFKPLSFQYFKVIDGKGACAGGVGVFRDGKRGTSLHLILDAKGVAEQIQAVLALPKIPATVVIKSLEWPAPPAKGADPLTPPMAPKASPGRDAKTPD